MMVTTGTGDRVEIRKTDAHRHKFQSAIDQYMYVMCDIGHDYSGDSECPTGWFARFGRRILFTDDRGFVWSEKYPEERSAEQVYTALDLYYAEWSDEDEDISEAARMMNLVELGSYLAYVVQCATENMDAHTFDVWKTSAEKVSDRFKGPLG